MPDCVVDLQREGFATNRATCRLVSFKIGPNWEMDYAKFLDWIREVQWGIYITILEPF